MTKTPFVEDPRGTVIAMAPEEYAGMSYLVSFPYTRVYINTIREGTFVAVRNFASNTKHRTFSVLELVSVLPRHYALGNSPEEAERAFPGFFDEAAKSARLDWEQEEPTELTTRIRSEAIPTRIQLNFAGDATVPEIESDQSLPMVGEEAHLLTDELTNEIVNRGLMDGSVATIAPCRMV
ncbi:ATPase-like protein, partial [mine drainage metagenome]